jgi:hypothetical protein
MLCKTIENQDKRGDLRLLSVKSRVGMAPQPEEIEWGPDVEREETDDDIFMVAELIRSKK